MPAKKRTSNSFYSYSAKRSLRQEEVSAYRRITVATLLVIGLIVGGYFLGVPLLANLGSGNNDAKISPLGTTDNIAPAAPLLNSLPDQTNTRTLTIAGTAESGSTVAITINDEEAFTALTDKDGQFSGEASLDGGENTISAIAKDAAGNKSRPSKPTTIVYDATPPSLVLLNEIPAQSSEQTVTINGKTEPNAKVTINDRQVVVTNDGIFNHDVQLKTGENSIVIIAKDPASNSRRIERTTTFGGNSKDDPSIEAD